MLVDFPHNGVLRSVSSHYGEDPLRPFRTFRFSAQLGFSVAEETYEAIRKVPQEEVLSLPKDRIREELVKALLAPYPHLFFLTMKEAGILDLWFPELAALIGCHHSPKHHPEGFTVFQAETPDYGVEVPYNPLTHGDSPEFIHIGDAFDHTMCVLRKAKELGAPLIGMLGALVHDLGKALTPVELRPRYINHETLGLEPVQTFCDRLGFGDDTVRALKFCCRNHMHMHKIIELRPNTLLKILAPLDRIKAHIRPETFALVCQSDHCGRGDVNWNLPYPQGDYLLGAMSAMQAVKIDPERLKKFQGDGEKIRAFVDAEKASALKAFRTGWFKIK